MDEIVHGHGCRTLLGWLEEYEQVKAMQRCLVAMGKLHPELSWLELVYEDQIEHDPYTAYRAVCNFLDLPVVDVDLRHRKISPGHLADLIANYDEVRDYLSPTRFAWMLTE